MHAKSESTLCRDEQSIFLSFISLCTYTTDSSEESKTIFVTEIKLVS